MDKYFKPIIVLAVISLVAGLILSYVYEITREPAEKVALEEKNKAMKTVLPNADTFESEEIGADTIASFSTGLQGSDVVGYAVEVTSIGYGGPISILVGVNTDGTVSGVDILSNKETPGLGANADKDEFKNQYKDKTGEFTVVKTGSQNENDIDAMAGATITSEAVNFGINTALEYIKGQGVLSNE